MNRFVMDYSVDITTAFNGLLDYIIGYHTIGVPFNEATQCTTVTHVEYRATQFVPKVRVMQKV